jgi:hypothetical protein
MKAGLINHHYPTRDSLLDASRLAAPLENLSATQYNRRRWHRRLPAVLIASLLIAFGLLAAGISLEEAAWLVLIPLVCLPLAGAVALSSV